MKSPLPPLRFHEHFVERIWGGRRLESLYDLPLPKHKRIGEAWLMSDHPVHESVVAEGPHAGKSLRALLESDASDILGDGAAPTQRGRFPLLLKLLDADDDLSVQVHPDDQTATRLGEPDVGKTEMWHVLHANAHSGLIAGIRDGVSAPDFLEAATSMALETLMKRIEVSLGDSMFVPAGTVHAIGRGIVLAEIQQNSDLTYRIYDYGRLQADGHPRTLHLEKAREAIHWGKPPADLVEPVHFVRDGTRCAVLAACRYFAAELLHVDGRYSRATRGRSFHILLSTSGRVTVGNGDGALALAAGRAALVPGQSLEFYLEGAGTVLDYYVPDIELDIVEPLRSLGVSSGQIAALLGRG